MGCRKEDCRRTGGVGWECHCSGPLTVSLGDLSALRDSLKLTLSKWLVLTAQDLGILSWVGIYYMGQEYGRFYLLYFKCFLRTLSVQSSVTMACFKK